MVLNFIFLVIGVFMGWGSFLFLGYILIKNEKDQENENILNTYYRKGDKK